MNKAVIFDTNAYRVFTYGKTIEECKVGTNLLKEKEADKDNVSFLSPIVLIELAAHLGDINDPAYENCKASFMSSYNHCKQASDDNFRLIPDGDSHLAKILFDYTNTAVLNKWEALGQLGYRMFTDSDESTIDNYRKYFIEIDRFVRFIEEQFVYDMHLHVIKGINPNATDWNPLKDDKKRRFALLKEIETEVPIDYFALAQVVKAANIAKVNLDEYNLFELTEVVKKCFPAPLYLYRNIFRKIIMTGADLTNPKKKRWNWIWDIQMLFGISNDTMLSKKTLLVTGDVDVIDAAKDAKLSRMIMSLPDYLQNVGYSQ